MLFQTFNSRALLQIKFLINVPLYRLEKLFSIKTNLEAFYMLKPDINSTVFYQELRAF